MTESNVAASKSSIRTLAPCRTPALVTNVCIPPNDFSAICMRFETCSSSVTSVKTNFASPPFFTITLMVSSASTSLISPITTLAPASAYAIAVAAPIPVEPPVITPTLSIS